MNMKKATYKLFTTAKIVLHIASCKDTLNLEPAQSVSNESALDNEEGVKQA